MKNNRGEPHSVRQTDGKVFLCHNHKDQPFVREIAELLELELGLPYFLDRYGIPAGERFLEMIDNALASSQSCLIFLSENGWGPTHLLEAEKALARYRSDPDYRLVPIVVSHVADSDLLRLGDGAVFREINWIRFTESKVEREHIDALRVALLGDGAGTDRGPAALTPYLIRRNAEQWAGSRDKSLLYRGRQLAEAERMAVELEAMMGADVHAFLTASSAHAKSRIRFTAIIAMCIVVFLTVLAGALYVENQTARSREVAALALASDDKHRGLLLATAAYGLKPTLEARSAMFALLNEVRAVEHYLHGHPSGIRSVDLHAPSRRVAAAGEGAMVSVWNIDDPGVPTWQKRLAPDTEAMIGSHRIHALRFTSRGNAIIAVLEYGGPVRWDLDTGRIDRIAHWPDASQFTPRVSTQHYGPDPEPMHTLGERAVTALAFDRSANLAVAGDSRGRIGLIEEDTRSTAWTTQARTWPISFLAIHAEADRIVASDDTGALSTYDLNGNPIHVFAEKVHRSELLIIDEFDGATISLDRSGIMVIWETGEDELLRAAEQRELTIRPVAAALDTDHRQILMSAMGGELHVYSLDDRSLTTLTGHRLTATSISCEAASPWCVSGDVGGELVLWRPDGHPLLASRRSLDADLVSGFRRRAKAIDVVTETVHEQLTQTEDGFIGNHILEVASYPLFSDSTETRIRIPHRFVGLAMKDDDVRVAVANSEEGVLLVTPGREKTPLRFVPRDIRPGRLGILAWSSIHLAAADNLRSLWVWRFDRPEEPIIEARLTTALNQLAFSPEGNYLVGTDLNGNITRWDLRNLSADKHTTKIADGPIFALAFDRSNRLLVASGAADREVRVLEMPTLKILDTLPSIHKGSLSNVAISSHRKVLATSDDTGVVHIWDYSSLRRLGSLHHPPYTLFRDIAFSPNDDYLLAAARNTVWIWNLEPDHMLVVARKIANRTLSRWEWHTVVGGRMPSGLRSQLDD